MKRACTILVAAYLLFTISGCTEQTKPLESGTAGSSANSAQVFTDSVSDASVGELSPQAAADGMVPFLLEKDGEARQAYWDISAQSVEIRPQHLYTYEKGLPYSPVFLWDGEQAFLFDKNAQVNTESGIEACFAQDLVPRTEAEREAVVGKNTVVYKNWDEDGAYTLHGLDIHLFENGAETLIQLNQTALPAGLPAELFLWDLCFVRYQAGTFLGVFLDLQANALVNVLYHTQTQIWETHRASNDTEMNLVPFKPARCVQVNDTLYLMSAIDLCALDLSDFTFTAVHPYFSAYTEYMHALLNTEMSSVYPIPHDGTNGVVLIHVIVSEEAFREEIIFAFRHDAYLGALHMRDGTFYAYDSNNNRVTALENCVYDQPVFAGNSSAFFG